MNTFQECINHLSSVRVWLTGVYIHECTHEEIHLLVWIFTHTHTLPARLSHVADILQPVAAAVLRQGEADVSALLPAAADLPEPPGHAGHEEGQAAQQDGERGDQDQYEGGRQVEAVLGRIKGAVPAKEEGVDGGHEQGTVTE